MDLGQIPSEASQAHAYSITDQSVKEQNSPEDHTDENENLVILTYKEIQIGAVAKSYMTNGLLSPYIWLIFAHFLIY
jgi:hypothetical protein